MEIIPFPVVMTKEGKWVVACCPILDVATQGKTEKEVKKVNYTSSREPLPRAPASMTPLTSSISRWGLSDFAHFGSASC